MFRVLSFNQEACFIPINIHSIYILHGIRCTLLYLYSLVQSTLYLRALRSDCMFSTKLLYNRNKNNHFINKDMDVPLGVRIISVHLFSCMV